MRQYLSITKGSYLSFSAYPVGVFFTLIGNLVYIVVVYFLWQRIYDGAATLRGMTFNEVFIYLTLASSIVILFHTWTDWQMSNRIREGDIALDLIKPLDYQLQVLAGSLGLVAFNGLMITIPSMVVVLIIFHASIPFGLNVLFFLPSLVFAYLLSFVLDYVVGLTAFYTQSLWGISITKEVITTLLSGALVPLSFFPDWMRNILQFLPFQAIFNIPLQIATVADLKLGDYASMLGIQLVWVIVFLVGSRLFYRQLIKVLIINGG